jgi:tripartite-type tricarboxylate transporter receptor subunit TctC
MRSLRQGEHEAAGVFLDTRVGQPGIGVPKNTPAEIIDKLNKEINAALADPKMKARLADLGSEGMPMTPAEFGKFGADETEKWGKVVKFAGIKPE